MYTAKTIVEYVVLMSYSFNVEMFYYVMLQIWDQSQISTINKKLISGGCKQVTAEQCTSHFTVTIAQPMCCIIHLDVLKLILLLHTKITQICTTATQWIMFILYRYSVLCVLSYFNSFFLLLQKNAEDKPLNLKSGKLSNSDGILNQRFIKAGTLKRSTS